MKNNQVNYSQVAQSEDFKALLATKRNFIVPLSVFFFIFYFTLPIMTAYSAILNTPAIGAITWAWVFAFGQFIMTWTLTTLYVRKASQFDQLVENILSKAVKGGK